MKTFKLLVAFFLGFSATNVMATTVFAPNINPDGTYEDVNFFYVSVPAGFTLGFFDATDTAFTTPLFVGTGDAVAVSPSTPGSGPYTATNTVSSSSISLGSTADFILGMNNGSTWLGDAGATPLNLGGTAYSVSFVTSPGTVLSVDLVLAQVPVPAAIWLFGSGLLGLVGVARRRA